MATSTQTSTKVSTKVGAALIGVAAIAAAVVLTTATKPPAITTPPKPNLALASTPTILTTFGSTPIYLNFGWTNNGTATVAFGAGQHPYNLAWVDPTGAVQGAACDTTVATGATMTTAVGGINSYGVGRDTTGCGAWLMAGAPAKADRIKVTLDPNNLIAESNEGDNLAFVALPFPNFSFTSAPAITNRALGFTWSNNGALHTSWPTGKNTVRLQFLDASSNIAGPACDLTGANMSAQLGVANTYSSLTDKTCGTWFGKPPANAAKLLVMLDPNLAVAESSETDNSVTINLPPKMANITFSAVKGPIASTDPLTFGFTNNGEVAAVFPAGSKILSMYYMNPPGTVVTSPACDYKLTTALTVAPGAVVAYDSSKDANCTAWYANRPATSIAVQVQFNPSSAVAESNNADNALTVNVPKPPGPANLTYAKTGVGGPTSVAAPLTFSFTNAGGTAATFPAGSRLLQMAYSDAKGMVNTKALCTVTTSAAVTVAPGANYNYDSSKDANCGAWYANRPNTAVAIQVIVNPSSVVAESNNADNSFGISVPVKK